MTAHRYNPFDMYNAHAIGAQLGVTRADVDRFLAESVEDGAASLVEGSSDVDVLGWSSRRAARAAVRGAMFQVNEANRGKARNPSARWWPTRD